MYDEFKTIGKSLLYHGKHNDRVYIMKIFHEDFEKVIEESEILAKQYNYGKIFAKSPKKYMERLIRLGYKVEGEIDKFYQGKEDCIFMGKFFHKDREEEKNKEMLEDVLKKSFMKEEIKKSKLLPKGYSIHSLDKNNVEEIADLYKQVFPSYPFPVFDANYIKETMDENIEYMGIFYEGKLIAIASGEKYIEYGAVEMTDFATLPQYRGQSLAIYLLEALEEKLLKTGEFQTFYTIARANSYSMNITFKKKSYKFCGTLINNTNISGSIESMNVWAKTV